MDVRDMTQTSRATFVLLSALYVVALAATTTARAQAPAPSVVERAVTYLAAEVPRWRQEHPCYSCHNNGDAARALVTAAGLGHQVGSSIDDTVAWISTPERWDSNALRGGSEDLPLARIQFSSALMSMVAWGRAGADAIDRAAALLVGHQRDDGSFRLSDSQILGNATFYGTALATSMAHRVLAASKTDAAEKAAARARAWLRSADTASVLDAASVLLGLERDGDAEAIGRRQQSLAVLKRSQGPDGGWGPYVTSQSEVFDTALALMALVMVRNVEALYGPTYTGRELEAAIAAARKYLEGNQNPDGSWVETTRPSGGESYAQRISTSAWALQALLVSQ
jgi:hypothetical protein